MFTILLVLSFALSMVYMYIEAVIYGLEKRKWALAAIVLGPMLLPMFQITKRMALRKVAGFDSVYLDA
ncbi:hypothetical protein ACFO4O_01545 [Glaciecola siphonariae]|uniref:Uncharacterized protein n=1 Tax=Glaciecola siphonariae TaxID=521012 RepID=A0ABV9LRM8_9ALTE